MPDYLGMDMSKRSSSEGQKKNATAELLKTITESGHAIIHYKSDGFFESDTRLLSSIYKKPETTLFIRFTGVD